MSRPEHRLGTPSDGAPLIVRSQRGKVDVALGTALLFLGGLLVLLMAVSVVDSNGAAFVVTGGLFAFGVLSLRTASRSEIRVDSQGVTIRGALRTTHLR